MSNHDRNDKHIRASNRAWEEKKKFQKNLEECYKRANDIIAERKLKNRSSLSLCVEYLWRKFRSCINWLCGKRR